MNNFHNSGAKLRFFCAHFAGNRGIDNVLIGFTQQADKLVFIAQPIVGRAHEPANPVCTLSGWLSGIGSDETVGKGLAPDHREAAFGTA